ncbi:MAG TPA: IS200/IS605 family transposase [Bacteroidales bacterium]|nr:IS200/IS605 family transposase [Bacteroidales bacterium]HPR13604.1 IS200/IS605 family transposase [Bacteroidales bacterium]HRW85566.1 IS200/IS605 family transposase [Bacteroidales bacterium]
MSFIKIWVHCVWTTKNRLPYLHDSIRYKVISHIRENAFNKGIDIDCINGFLNHLHVLISLGGRQNISDLMQKIKGESSYWINKNKLTRLRFEWQDDFYAVSVGAEHLDNLRNYIKNQEIHHKKVSLVDEVDKLIEEYNLTRIPD